MNDPRPSRPARARAAAERRREQPAQRIDPRINKRRIAVLRARGRRRLRVTAAALIVVALAGAAFWASHTHLMDVDRIVVSGVESDDLDAVLASSGVDVGSPMLYLDVDSTEFAVESLPWVRSALVRRDWPSTVRITVWPRVPSAVVPAAHDRAAVIDPNGYVIGWAPEAPDAAQPHARLPYVSVPFAGRLGDIHSAAAGPLAVVAAMPEDLRDWVAAVTLAGDPGADRATAPGGIGLELVGGATVVLGEPVLIDDKISALRAMLARAELECITTIDVTMPDIATVTRLPAASACSSS
ncbi:MAG: FtsQ-type POTRA domain-containing protein [Acidimicrobiaceae bacterium]|nr:FtsQ-type POTRA domain-containing protein [Acidimicrobiaceae bacterium]MCY4294570.1 FtsQ-type POTRA domain-containing protein [Acidimicrobiaceae bacterium]